MCETQVISEEVWDVLDSGIKPQAPPLQFGIASSHLNRVCKLLKEIETSEFSKIKSIYLTLFSQIPSILVSLCFTPPHLWAATILPAVATQHLLLQSAQIDKHRAACSGCRSHCWDTTMSKTRLPGALFAGPC